MRGEGLDEEISVVQKARIELRFEYTTATEARVQILDMKADLAESDLPHMLSVNSHVDQIDGQNIIAMKP